MLYVLLSLQSFDVLATKANGLCAWKAGLTATQQAGNLISHSIEELALCLDTGLGDGGNGAVGLRLHGALVVMRNVQN